jgi:hypothetical protein
MLAARYEIIATNGGKHNATTNMDKTKLLDSNTTNCLYILQDNILSSENTSSKHRLMTTRIRQLLH